MATFQSIILKGNVHIRQDETTNIKIRISHKGKTAYISTDLYVHHKKFRKGHATGANADFINTRLRDELQRYTKNYMKLGSLPDKLTVHELREKVSVDPELQEIDFLEFAENYRQELIATGRDGSARGLKGVIFNLRKFRPTLMVSQITLRFLDDFYDYLTRQGVRNARDNYMREFRLLFREAVNRYNDEDRGIIRIPNYPFRAFKFQKIKKEKRHRSLTVDQLRAIYKFLPERERQQMATDMLMLMFCLIGINTKDLYYLLPANKHGRVKYRRSKTGREYSIKLEPEAQEIIQRYKGEKWLINASQRYSDYLNWQKYINYELKLVCGAILEKMKESDPKAEFPQAVATNWARHTWATIARNDCRIDKDDVALCLGHEDTDNKVTDVYIRYDYSIIDESNRKVLDKIFK